MVYSTNMVTNKQQPTKRGRGRPPIYPWDKWLKPNRSILLKKGRDFHCEMRTFELLARHQAKRRGLEASISIRDLSLIMEVN